MSTQWVVNPFLHVETGHAYDPLTDRRLEGDRLARLAPFDGAEDAELREGGWIVPAGTDLSHRYRLRIVSLETMSSCNQKCYFCPVSVDPREDETMPTALVERIVNELTSFRDTIEGVFLQSYNEPTLDRRFVDHCRLLFAAGLPAAILTNG